MTTGKQTGEAEAAEAVAGAHRLFRTDHLKGEVGRLAVRGGVVMLASQGAKFAINIVSTVTLARLLSPQDYGLVAMAAVFTNLTYLVRNLGLSAATVQRDEINHQQVSTLFWINVGLSLLTTLVTAAMAPLIAAFYGEPRLAWVTAVIAVGFIFSGLGTQHEALLKRQMRFRALGAIDLVSILLGLLVGVTAAWAGKGVWALVAAQLTVAASLAAGVWAACGWRPGPPVRNSGVRSMLAFGGNLTVYNFLNYLSRNADNLLIGRFWGPLQLGLYSRAYQLLLLPLDQVCGPLDGVVVSALSRLNDAPDRFRRAYLRILEKLAMLTMPGVALMIGTADWLVTLLLGAQWAETALIFAAFGIVGLLEPVSISVGWLLISQGRTRHVLHWGFIDSALSLASIVAGLPWGALGVAISYSLAGFLLRKPLLFWFACRTGPVRAADFYRAIFPPFCAALGVLAALFAFRAWVGEVRPFVGLLAALPVAVVSAFTLFFVFPRGRAALRDVWSLLSLFRKGEGSAAALGEPAGS